jgi:hypothetical protein
MLPVTTRGSISHCLLYKNKKANTVDNRLGFGVGLPYDWSALIARAYLPPCLPRLLIFYCDAIIVYPIVVTRYSNRCHHNSVQTRSIPISRCKIATFLLTEKGGLRTFDTHLEKKLHDKLPRQTIWNCHFAHTINQGASVKYDSHCISNWLPILQVLVRMGGSGTRT